MSVERGFNGYMGATGYGWRRIAVKDLFFGIGIISSRDESRNSQAFYGVAVTSGSFTMTVLLSPWSEYESFSKWLRGYGQKISAGGGGPMRVIVPARNIDRVGILESGITLGRDVKTKVWQMQLGFIGSREPITNNADSPLVSSFTMPKNDPESAPFFYPGGIQLAGELGIDDIYGAPDTGAPDLPSDSKPTPGPVRRF